MNLRARLDDVSVVTVTPFADGGLHLDGVRKNATYLADAGVRVIVCGGNTGEFYALSLAELAAVVETTVDAVPEDVLVLGGAGYRPELAVRGGREAVAAGAHAVMLHYPPHPYIGEAGLARYYAEIVGALDAPAVLYVRGPQLTERVVEAATAAGEVVGVKFGVPDLATFGRLAEAFPHLAWVCGIAEGWAPAFWQAGARGFTSGLGNFAPRLSLALRDSLRIGNVEETQLLWRQLVPFEQLRARRGDANNVAAVKAALDRIGLAGGPLRPPLAALPQEDVAELDAILAAWGLI